MMIHDEPSRWMFMLHHDEASWCIIITVQNEVSSWHHDDASWRWVVKIHHDDHHDSSGWIITLYHEDASWWCIMMIHSVESWWLMMTHHHESWWFVMLNNRAGSSRWMTVWPWKIPFRIVMALLSWAPSINARHLCTEPMAVFQAETLKTGIATAKG